MHKKLLTAILVLIVLTGVTTFFFIKFSNDHKECNDVVSKTTDMDGNTIVASKHICREKYNL